MCGIVGAVAERDVVPVLMEGLRRLEYRGYDSAGIAVLNGTKHLTRLRTVGKVRMLDEALEQTPTAGKIGIAHTRWATHGVPSERNAHPHISRDGLALGLGKDENFVASDVAALLPVTRRFVFLEEGDVAEVRRRSVRVIDRDGHVVERAVRESDLSADAAERGPYPHYMLKEIHEQPR